MTMLKIVASLFPFANMVENETQMELQTII